MATNGLETVRKVGGGVTPIIVGTLLVQGTVALPALGQTNVFLGWAIVIVGVLDLFQAFTK